jgi:hypothetical protein
MRLALPILSMTLLAGGCAVSSGKERLERLLEERGEPYAVTVFRLEPGEGERPISELRAALDYWNGPGKAGIPRWRGVLEPEPTDLYGLLLARIDGGASALTLVAYRYDAIGFDDVTLVDYLDEDGRRLGSDHLPYVEPDVIPAAPLLVGYWDLAWWEYPMMLLDLPVYLAIGLKELAGEAVKTPLSALSSGWIAPMTEARSPLAPVEPRRAAAAIVEDVRNGWTAFTWRFRVRSRHTPLDLARDLAGALPIAGPFFDHRSPPEDSAPPAATALIAVSQGIHARGDAEQFTEAWRRALEELRPETLVISTPYRHGGFADVLWSTLNLSHGFAYDLAHQLVFLQGLGAGDTVELAGFSGGCQRAIAASGALRRARVNVRRIVGVAGPVAGNSCAMETTLLLGRAADDPAVLAARALQRIPIYPAVNARVEHVPGAGAHHLPYFPAGKTRAPEAGYDRSLRGALGR